MANYDSYSDAGPSTAEPAEDEPSGDEKAEDTEENSALLPKSLFGHDCRPGDQYTVEVTDTFEDEVAVKYVRSDKSDKSEPAMDMKE